MSTVTGPRFNRSEFFKVARRALEKNFDASANLVGPAPYFLPPSLAYAWVLLEDGSPEAVTRAQAILATVLSSQETRTGHPDFGHFRMLFEDPGVADLNAVQLVLIELIPLARLHVGRLSPDLREAAFSAIRAGLHALDDIDAHLTYSNVAVLDIANRILGGETVGDPDAVARGVGELDAFIDYTNQHGGFRDYNSPTYMGQMLNTVATLANHTADSMIIRKAELIQERLWLEVATHYHPGLAQFVGPYSRAYPPDVVGGLGQTKSILFAYLDDERLLGEGKGLDRMPGFSAFHLATRSYFVPAYVLGIAAGKELPAEVRESAERDAGLVLASHLGVSHGLGTASRGFGSQARNLIAHMAPRLSTEPKVLFSRYLASGEERDLNSRDPRMTEWGLFAGLQRGSQSIALYGAPLEYRRVEWLGVELYLLGAEDDDGVWSEEEELRPGDSVPAERWLFLDLGTAYVGVYTLVPTHLGGNLERPVTLHRDGGMLRLAITNYDGPARHFWKFAPLPWEYPEPDFAPFFSGNLRAGVLIETADAAAWDSFVVFRRTIVESRIKDTVEAKIRRVVFERDGRRLELAVDLRSFAPIDRRVDGSPESPVSLEAPGVVQVAEPVARVDGQSVRSSQVGPWVVTTDEATFLANPTPQAVVLTLGGRDETLPPFARATLDRQGRVSLDTATADERTRQEKGCD